MYTHVHVYMRVETDTPTDRQTDRKIPADRHTYCMHACMHACIIHIRTHRQTDTEANGQISDIGAMSKPHLVYAFSILSWMGSDASVASRAEVMTKASSTPIAIRIKGRICCKVVKGTPHNIASACRSQRPSLPSRSRPWRA